MRISVVVPVLDAEPYLGQALGSVLEQTRPPDEVIVVDDGSTDGSLLTAQRFAGAFPGLVRVVDARTGCAARARNLGAALATGEALMFLDADDVVGPETLDGLARALATAPAGVAVCPWYRLDRLDERWVQRPASCVPRRPGQDALQAWLSGWYSPPCSVLWSRQAFDRAGRWDELSTVNDDGDLMMRALVTGAPLLSSATGAAYYRRHPTGARTSLSGTRTTEAGLRSELRVLDKIGVWVEEVGSADSYRWSLARAYERVADAARPFPALAARARATAAAQAPGAFAGAWQDAAERIEGPAGRARARVRRAVHRAVRGGGPVATVEVTAGAGTAARALGCRAAAVEAPSSERLPLVTVVLPTYDRAHLLPRAVASVLAQTQPDWELLIVDDGSTDDTDLVVKDYDDPRIRYLRQDQNQGVSAARNRGLREARGSLIAFLDSDDEWLPDKLRRQVAGLRELPDTVGLLYTGVLDDDGAGGCTVRAPAHRGDVHRALLQGNVVHGTSSVVIRRCVVASAGFFDEQIPAIEDYDYWLRVSRWFAFDYLEEPLIRYHDARALVRKSLHVGENLEARAFFYRKHRRELWSAGLESAFLLRSARRHLLDDSCDLRGARPLSRRALRLTPLSREAQALALRAHLPLRVLEWRRRRRMSHSPVPAATAPATADDRQ